MEGAIEALAREPLEELEPESRSLRRPLALALPKAAAAAVLPAFVLSRALLVAVTAGTALVRAKSPIAIWDQWDTTWYLGIAQNGYHWSLHGKSALAFFPLFPLLLHALMGAGVSGIVAGLLLANSAFLGALFYLHRLVRVEWGAAAAERAMWLLAFFPAALFFFAPYTESLFLLAGVGALYHARQSQCARAGVWLALALLTRSTALILIVPVLYFASARTFGTVFLAQPAAIARRCVAIAAPCLITWMAYLYYLSTQHISLFPLLTAQRGWHRSLTWPWTGFVSSLEWLALRGSTNLPWAIENLLQLTVTIVFLALTLKAWPTLGTAMRLYSAGFWLLVLLMPEWRDGFYAPFMSMDRFVLALFPIAGWAATEIKGRPLRLVIVGFSLVLAFATGFDLAGGWIG